MKTRISRLISCTICIAMIMMIITPVQVPAYAAEKRGNTSGNLANYGEVAQSGDWIFFVNYEDGKSSICKVKTDGTGFTTIRKKMKGRTDHLNVVNGWVYYFKHRATGSLCKLYRIRTNGEDNQKLSNDDMVSYPGGCLAVYNGWIYYGTNGTLYKMKTNGTKKTKIVKVGGLWSFCVSGNWIYYIDCNKKGIYKIKTDGRSKKFIKYNKKGFSGFTTCQVSDGWLYCGDGVNNVYRVKTTGTKLKKVLSNVWCYSYNANNRWLYYSIEDKGIYKMKLGGTAKQKISSQKKANGFQILNDMMYFYVTDENWYNHPYRMKTDGTDLQKGWFPTPVENSI